MGYTPVIWKFLTENMMRLLTKFYNSCIIHEHLPAALLEGCITPRLKDKNGMLDSSENYRKIMISSNLFKFFEYMLLPIIKRSVVLSASQFGYRKSTSILMAVTILKEIMTKCTCEGSTVYTSFFRFEQSLWTCWSQYFIGELD